VSNAVSHHILKRDNIYKNKPHWMSSLFFFFILASKAHVCMQINSTCQFCSDHCLLIVGFVEHEIFVFLLFVIVIALFFFKAEIAFMRILNTNWDCHHCQSKPEQASKCDALCTSVHLPTFDLCLADRKIFEDYFKLISCIFTSLNMIHIYRL